MCVGVRGLQIEERAVTEVSLEVSFDACTGGDSQYYLFKISISVWLYIPRSPRALQSRSLAEVALKSTSPRNHRNVEVPRPRDS